MSDTSRSLFFSLVCYYRYYLPNSDLVAKRSPGFAAPVRRGHRCLWRRLLVASAFGPPGFIVSGCAIGRFLAQVFNILWNRC